MLQKIRNKSQSWIAWVIVGLIIITFALFGIDQYAQSEKTVVVAEVNGEDITGKEFFHLYSQQKRRLQSQFGDMYEQVVKDEELRGSVLDSLIESKLIQQYFDDGNMGISNEHLSATIQSSDVFQKDGVFDKVTYEQILARNGLSIARYEYEQRKFMMESQYKELTSSSAFVTESQLKNLAKLQFQQRKFNYLRIDQRELLKNIEVSESQVAEFFAENKLDYVIPEKVTVDYLLLSQNEIAKKIEINEGSLETYYEENKDQFVFTEQREASHILVGIDDPSQEESALKKIRDIQAKLTAGKDFGQLAKEFSDDPGSAKLNGDLGKFKQGMMVPEFDNSVFSLEEGQVSEPVKTDFGYHLIKLTKIHPKYIKAYTDVKQDVEASYRQREAEQVYFNLLEKLSSLTYEQPDTLDSAAAAIDIDVQTSQAFSRSGGEGIIASNQKVIVASFSEDVKDNRINSSLLEISPTSSVVVRVNKIIPASQKELADVASEIENKIKQQKSKQASADLATKILAEINTGQDFKSFAKEGVEYKTVDWVQRENSTVLPQLNNAVFKAIKPSAEDATYLTTTLSLGDSVIIELVAVKEGDTSASKESAEQLKNALLLIKSDAEINSRISNLFEKAEIDKKAVYLTLK